MSDIMLTPLQRQLKGLPPSSAPPTPGSAYTTPPKYTRSTPQSSGSRAAIFGSSPFDRSASGSPISGSPLAGRGPGSPYGLSGYGTSPAGGSPLVRKAVEGRRFSAGGVGLRGSELDFNDSSRSSLPGSPSPSGGQRGASVALNSKWLYQRGKGSPGGRALYS
jgi:nucleoporin POM34